MDECNNFEVAIEKRIHGALTRDEEGPLTIHLETCERCRTFENVARNTENVMSQQARIYVETTDWEALFSQTKTFIDKSARRRITTGGAVLVAMTAWMMLIGHNQDRVLLQAICAGVVVFSAIWIGSRIKIARLTPHHQDAGELLFVYRSELERMLRATHKVAIVPLVIPFFFLAIREQLVSLRAWVGFVGMVCVMVASSAYVLLVRRPRLQRELNALKAEVKK